MGTTNLHLRDVGVGWVVATMLLGDARLGLTQVLASSVEGLVGHFEDCVCVLRKFEEVGYKGTLGLWSIESDGNLEIVTVSYRWLCLARDIMGSDVCHWHDDIAGHQDLEYYVSNISPLNPARHPYFVTAN